MTNSFNLPQVADNQNNKEATINAAVNQLGDLLGAPLAVDLTSGDYSLSASESRNYAAYLCSGHAVPRTLTVMPYPRYFIADNRGSDDLTVSCGSGSVLLAADTRSIMYTDGTTDGIISVGSGGATVANQTVNYTAPFAGAVLSLTANDTSVTFPVQYEAWDTAQYDTDSFWLGPNVNFTADNTTDYLAATSHGLSTGDGPFYLKTTGTLPTVLSSSTKYWAIKIDANTIQLATSKANALANTAVNFSSNGSGTHTIAKGEYIRIPAGVAKVSLMAGCDFEALATAGSVFVAIHKNQADLSYGITGDVWRSGTTGFNDNANNCATVAIPVSEDDLFSVRLHASMSGQDTIQNTRRTFFSIKVEERDDVQALTHDIHHFFAGTPTVSVTAFAVVAGTDFTLPTSLTDSAAYAEIAPSGGSVVFDVQKNGVSIGSVTFASGSNTATFTFAADVSFANGDVLSIVSPSNLRSMANISFTFSALKQ
jgi:hypothetical protein